MEGLGLFIAFLITLPLVFIFKIIFDFWYLKRLLTLFLGSNHSLSGWYLALSVISNNLISLFTAIILSFIFIALNILLGILLIPVICLFLLYFFYYFLFYKKINSDIATKISRRLVLRSFIFSICSFIILFLILSTLIYYNSGLI